MQASNIRTCLIILSTEFIYSEATKAQGNGTKMMSNDQIFQNRCLVTIAVPN